MENRLFIVSAQICQQIKIEFSAVEHDFKKIPNSRSLVEVDKVGLYRESGGMFIVEPALRKAGVGFGPFRMRADILSTEKAGNNTLYKCVTDLFKMDVYVCDAEEWKQKKESIFF